MLVRILAGEKKGQLVHVPREQLTDLLVTLGLIEPAAPPTPTIVHPPAGWQVERGQYSGSVFLVKHDGHGGSMRSSVVPGPTRQYRWDVDTQTETFEMVPSDCPQAVIDEFIQLGGRAS